MYAFLPRRMSCLPWNQVFHPMVLSTNLCDYVPSWSTKIHLAYTIRRVVKYPSHVFYCSGSKGGIENFPLPATEHSSASRQGCDIICTFYELHPPPISHLSRLISRWHTSSRAFSRTRRCHLLIHALPLHITHHDRLSTPVGGHTVYRPVLFRPFWIEKDWVLRTREFTCYTEQKTRRGGPADVQYRWSRGRFRSGSEEQSGYQDGEQ